MLKPCSQWQGRYKRNFINCHTAGVSDSHAWGLMLPSSSRVSPVTYHSVVAVRYPDLCRVMDNLWELGSFASGGIPDRPPGFQFVLWDTEARINGLVAADLNTLVSHVIEDFEGSTSFSNGLFVMTTATDHKNNLNRSTIKKTFSPNASRGKPSLTRQEALLQ